jgi:hypothetical protein
MARLLARSVLLLVFVVSGLSGGYEFSGLQGIRCLTEYNRIQHRSDNQVWSIFMNFLVVRIGNITEWTQLARYVACMFFLLAITC